MAFSIFLDNDPAGFSGADRLARALLGLTGVDLRWIAMPSPSHAVRSFTR